MSVTYDDEAYSCLQLAEPLRESLHRHVHVPSLDKTLGYVSSFVDFSSRVPVATPVRALSDPRSSSE